MDNSKSWRPKPRPPSPPPFDPYAGSYAHRNKLALGCLSEENWIRILCKRIVGHQWFDRVVLVAILVNATFLTFERPALKDGSQARVMLCHALMRSVHDRNDF